MTWADIAQRPAQPAEEGPATDLPDAGGTAAVLDASAVISGFDRHIADRLVTVAEAIDECKDALAKQRLQLLPEGLTVKQPSADSIKTGEAQADPRSVCCCKSSLPYSTGGALAS